MLDIDLWWWSDADLYEVKLCKFLWPVSWQTKFSCVPASSRRPIPVILTEWFATFLFCVGRPALWAAFERNIPMEFFPSGAFFYQTLVFGQFWFNGEKKWRFRIFRSMAREGLVKHHWAPSFTSGKYFLYFTMFFLFATINQHFERENSSSLRMLNGSFFSPRYR